MTSSIAFWVACAVLLFWAVGAYNRLVRLRGEVNAAFGALDTVLSQQVTLVEHCLPEGQTQPASLFDGMESSFWGGLQSAAHQLQASLALARPRPLVPEGIAALGAAQDVLAMAWERAERDDAHDLAGPRLPPTLTSRRAQLVAQADAATAHFDQAVDRYNQAIAQFPALLLAWLFGFQRGRALRATT